MLAMNAAICCRSAIWSKIASTWHQRKLTTICNFSKVRSCNSSTFQPSSTSQLLDLSQSFRTYSTSNTQNPFAVSIVNLETGENTGSVTLDRTVFGSPIRTDLIHRVVVWQLAARRAGLASSKGRSEKSGSTRKIYRQKGTGHARAGSIRAPQRKGSGKAHGPQPRDWSYRLQKKVRDAGLRSALSSKFALGRLSIASEISCSTAKTKKIGELSKKLGWNNRGVLVIYGENRDDNFFLATKNLPYITYGGLKKCNVYEILKQDRLVLDVNALNAVQNRLKLL